ncbi:splicing factor 3b subunit 1 SF3b1 [Gracilaria domingensis]|nr:splicing factor 3b subunit 1 SF3b1 [Gracilaria domingensis]
MSEELQRFKIVYPADNSSPSTSSAVRRRFRISTSPCHLDKLTASGEPLWSKGVLSAADPARADGVAPATAAACTNGVSSHRDFFVTCDIDMLAGVASHLEERDAAVDVGTGASHLEWVRTVGFDKVWGTKGGKLSGTGVAFRGMGVPSAIIFVSVVAVSATKSQRRRRFERDVGVASERLTFGRGGRF